MNEEEWTVVRQECPAAEMKESVISTTQEQEE